MDDPHRRPEDADRARLAARIDAAHAAGRIGATDRDIRLGNVRSAQSMVELDLMSRDLDQLDAAFPTVTPTAPGAFARFEPRPDAVTADGRRTVDLPPRTVRVLAVVIGVVVVLVAALLLVLGLRATILSEASGGDPEPEQVVPSPSTPAAPSNAGRSAVPERRAGGPAYALTARGIDGFLRTYSTRFRTSRVVDLVLYGDYAIVHVPLSGSRQQGWIWRDSTGFSRFGGATVRFPGTRPVDIRRLDVPALVRNIRRARTQLGVDRPSTTYVVVRGSTRSGEAVRVDIHVANEFRESAYLATRLDGSVQRAFPFRG